MWNLPEGHMGKSLVDPMAIAHVLVPELFCTRSSTVSSLFNVLALHSRSCVSSMENPLLNNLWCKPAKKAGMGVRYLGQHWAYNHYAARPLQSVAPYPDAYE
ncbi:hypothetical protein TNCV_657971 [Trichonephila clavipes]|uniref:Uncharacterized protein n=1 Tax=Trichonephila clavipes TaxID=2585209 RepID=A0A8X6SPA2_TRICX|nr:hypothetical protein TNCV_657971 [Trichonephila clavipes]